jgi:hypothetical protein
MKVTKQVPDPRKRDQDRWNLRRLRCFARNERVYWREAMELAKSGSLNDLNMYTFFANSLTTPVVKMSITDGVRADDKA